MECPRRPRRLFITFNQDGAADQAGLQPGDRIISFNGTENPSWDVISGDALLSPGRPLPVVVNRNGQEVAFTITPTTRTENGEAAGFLDFVPDYGGLPVVVGDVATRFARRSRRFERRRSLPERSAVKT